jgi:hypothetical protein
MEQCVTEQAWVRYAWTFENILVGLPGPGTPAFAALARDLRSYGLSPAGISLETPSGSLADVSWNISLLEGDRALVRVYYGFFDISISYVSEGDDKAFAGILTAVTSALSMLDPNSKEGREQCILRAHLTLSSGDPQAFLGNRLIVIGENSLSPDSFYYRLGPNASTQAESMRIGVTKSLAFDKALFVELTADYNTKVQSDQVGERFAEDANTIFALLGLQTRSKGRVD